MKKKHCCWTFYLDMMENVWILWKRWNSMSKKCNVKSALLNLAKVCPIASDLRKKKLSSYLVLQNWHYWSRKKILRKNSLVRIKCWLIVLTDRFLFLFIKILKKNKLIRSSSFSWALVGRDKLRLIRE
jgi:hypothetical protein